MKGVTSEVIAEVRQRANILEVISEFVVLKRTGKEHKGLCPFHPEKSPSFHVNLDKGIYKCFGCGEGGDVFAFMQKIKGLDFLDAVRDLAQKYGVQLVETVEEKQQFDKRSAILMLYQQASEYYCHLLKDPVEGAFARQYLQKRGVTEEIIERFKLGYAANSWDGLLSYLTTSTKVAPQTLEEAGLVRRKQDSNSFYDLFRNRLMIPICDDQGRVIAFGGRTLGDDQVKYLNSPETPIYTKGQHLFAFNLAKDAIKAQDSVVVVEGYFDAITPHQFGFSNTVATLGTALTEHQARSLVRYTESKRVYLAFDADAAGERAIERGVETLNQIATGIGIELRVVRVPGGKDPDECLRGSGEHAGTEAYARAIANAPLLIDYQLEQTFALCNPSTHTGRIEASRRLIPVLSQIKDNVGRGEYIKLWAMKVGVREEELLADVRQYRRDHRLDQSGSSYQQRRPAETRHRAPLQSGYLLAEQQVLALYLLSRDDYDRAYNAFAEWTLISNDHQRIKEAIEGIGSQFNTVEDLQYKLQDRLGPEKDLSAALIEIILKVEEMRKQDAPIEKLLLEFKARLLKEKLTRTLASVRFLLASAQNESEQELLQSRISQLNQFERVSLVSAGTLEELDELKRKIETVTGAKEPIPTLETTV